VAQHATGEELAELLLDEAREAVSVAAVRDFPEKELQVLADHGVEHGVFGVAGLIRAMGIRQQAASLNPAGMGAPAQREARATCGLEA